MAKQPLGLAVTSPPAAKRSGRFAPDTVGTRGAHLCVEARPASPWPAVPRRAKSPLLRVPGPAPMPWPLRECRPWCGHLMHGSTCGLRSAQLDCSAAREGCKGSVGRCPTGMDMRNTRESDRLRIQSTQPRDQRPPIFAGALGHADDCRRVGEETSTSSGLTVRGPDEELERSLDRHVPKFDSAVQTPTPPQ